VVVANVSSLLGSSNLTTFGLFGFFPKANDISVEVKSSDNMEQQHDDPDDDVLEWQQDPDELFFVLLEDPRFFSSKEVGRFKERVSTEST
jgi:hypothetical protein